MSVATHPNGQIDLDKTTRSLRQAHALWGIGDWAPVRMMEQPANDLACISRPKPFEIGDTVNAATIGTARSTVNTHHALRITRDLYASLGIDDDCLALDSAALVAAFENILPGREIQMRIDVCDTTTCPKFHHDNRHVRLVTTYYGPTTQYIMKDHSDHVYSASLWELLLFKGSQHPTFSELVVHRSPPMTQGQRRLCLVIDC